MRSDLIANCGSRIYNLEKTLSDYDYLNLISGTGASIYEKGTCYNNPIDSPEKPLITDTFRIRTDSFYDIHSCAGILMIHLYDQTCGGESMILRRFWKLYNKGLAEIDLCTSYFSAIQEVSYDIENNRINKFGICARILGLMHCRYYTNHLFEARKLSSEWISRYWRGKSGKVDINEVKSWIEELKTPSIEKFYRNQPVNIKLHDEYKLVLDQVLADSPIT